MNTRWIMIRSGRPPRRRLRRAKEIFAYLRPRARGLDRECFWRIDLDSRLKPIGCELVSVGTLDASLAEPPEILRGALLQNARAFVVAHNHPSGDPRPSAEDRETTLRLALCGLLFGIQLADHVILTDDRYFSFKEARLL